jgi:hypothetical protein
LDFSRWSDDNPGVGFIIIDHCLSFPAHLLDQLLVDHLEESSSASVSSQPPIVICGVFLDQVFCQSSTDLHQVPDGSINAAISSFPYEDQVDYGDDPENLGRYRGDEFIDRAVRHLEALKPKVKLTGNIFIELQSSIRDGASSLAEEKFAIAAVERCGLFLVQRLYSIRTNAEPLAPPNRLHRGVVPIFHLVRDRKQYVTYKDHVRKVSAWAARDLHRPNKYNDKGKDPGDLLWSREELLSGIGPDHAAINAAGAGMNLIASPKAQNHRELGHPAVMADAVAEFLVLYGTNVGGTVMDVMGGVGTTLLAARKHGRRFVGFEINPKFAAVARQRLGISVQGETTFGSLLGPEGSVAPVTTTAPAILTPSVAPMASTLPPPRRPLPRQPVTATCVCGKEFPKSRKSQRFCSEKCRWKYNNDSRPRKHDQKTEGQ